MKKNKTLILFSLIILILSGCGNKKEPTETFKGNIEIQDESGDIIISTANLKSVSTVGDDEKGYSVEIIVDESGTEKFAEVTANSIGEKLYIYIDNNLVSAPIVNQAIIDGTILITGFDSSLSAYEIVSAIKNGNYHQEEKEQETIAKEEQTKTDTPEQTINETTDIDKQANSDLENKTEKEEIPHRDGMYGISDKDIYDIGGPSVFTRDDVNNDVTGNWRVSAINKSFEPVYYALSYYEKYFHSDKEIHAIVNFCDNTTTCIQTFGGNELYVTTYDYVKGEEHNADLMFSGTELAAYIIYIDNGDIEYISE